jgi:imidazolonepropionase-like amidohydrolase
VQLTRVARQYANPSWSADGSKIVLAWRAPNYGNTANVAEDDVAHDIVWIASAGGHTHTISSVRPRNAGRWFPVPQFSGDGSRVYFIAAASETRNDVVSVALDGSDRRSIARFKYIEEAAPSPDGKQLAFVAMDDVYVTELPPAGADPVEIDLDRPAAPLKRLTRDGGGYVHWSGDGRSLEWSYAAVAYRQRLDREQAEEVRVDVTVPRAVPSGTLLLTGARVLTMTDNDKGVQQDILVRGGRIVAVGKTDVDRNRSGDLRIVDVTGKTIIPGLIDAHYHGHYQGQEIFPTHKWQYLADLAYGVTTGREVSAPTRDTMAQADMVDAGEMIGPRVYGTGWPLFPARDGGANHVVSVNSLDDARQHVRRLKRSGVTYLKQYLQPRREQRQWLVQAAREEGLMITAEGGGLKVQTTMMLDGFTGFEHSIPVAPVYSDIVQLMARTGTVYTPTFVAGYAKPGSMDFYYASEDVHENRRASRFIPHDLLDRFTSIRILIPDAQYLFRSAARGAYEIRKAKGNVAVGGHGNHPGLGPHWELWSFVEGGMPPIEALRAATLGGAEMLGIQQDAGSIETGKVADLVILNSDPRSNIKNSIDVYRVMKAGQLYDPDDLARRLPWAPAPGKPGTAQAGRR